MKVEDFLVCIRSALEQAHVPYMLTGSLASSIHGIPRATNDIDIVVAPTPEQLSSLIEQFEQAGLYISREEASAALRGRTQFNVDFANALKADFIIRKSRQFSLIEFERREEMDLEGLRLIVASAEDVMISKLEWAKLGDSERQLMDVAGILRLQGERLDFEYLRRWVQSLELQQQWQSARDRAAWP